MYRLYQPKRRLTLIAILVGALLPLYPASSALAGQDNGGKGEDNQHSNGNQKQNKQNNQGGDHKQFNHQGNHGQVDHQSGNKNFDRRQYTNSQGDNHWRNDRQGNHTQYSQNNNRWRHDRSNNQAWSKYRDNNYRYHSDGKWYRQPQTRVVYVFVPQHRERMRDYFMMHRTDLPRYYYDDYYDDLPYGMRRQLVVNGYFPQGLEDRLYPFPSELNRWLGPTPYGTRRVMFGRDAYLLQDRTNLILDIIQGLARR